MLNDTERQISVAATSTRSSPAKTLSQLSPYTIFIFEVPGVAVVAIYCWASFNFYGMKFFSTFWLIDSHTISSRHNYSVSKLKYLCLERPVE